MNCRNDRGPPIHLLSVAEQVIIGMFGAFRVVLDERVLRSQLPLHILRTSPIHHLLALVPTFRGVLLDIGRSVLLLGMRPLPQLLLLLLRAVVTSLAPASGLAAILILRTPGRC